MHKFRSIASLQPNPRRLSKQNYYKKNAAKMKAENSARYRKKATAEREIPDGLASPAYIASGPESRKTPTTPSWKEAKKKAQAKAKAQANSKSQAKKVLQKPKAQEKRKRAKRSHNKE